MPFVNCLILFLYSISIQDLAAPTAMCKRDGTWAIMGVKDLVVGDLIQLKGGDVIPADCKAWK